jgi:hypothetical protein
MLLFFHIIPKLISQVKNCYESDIVMGRRGMYQMPILAATRRLWRKIS